MTLVPALPLTMLPQDFVPVRTRDGSLTLRSEEWGEQYHSRHGAVQESTHVYIRTGLEHTQKRSVDVLEVGLGTGLNLLLTWIRCLEGKCTATYTALEPFPLTRDQLEAMAHCEDLAWPGLHTPFMERMLGPTDTWHGPVGGLTFRLLHTAVAEFGERDAYDVVYFDAFSPASQPGMWTPDVFHRMFAALRPGGLLVTYCAKGEVRRAMRAAGFKVERLPGPPGKRQMFRAQRPL